MDDTLILDQPWPDGLDPATVSFRKRSVTILKRMGFYDDPSLFNTLTEGEVLSWTNAGPKTVADIRTTGDEAIRRHHAESALLQQVNTDLAAVADEPWAKHVWHRDPRFKEYLPRVDSTVYDLATSGTPTDKRLLWGNLDDLRATLQDQAALSLQEAVAQYVGLLYGVHGHRLDVLLAVTGLNGQDPIGGREASRQIQRSHSRGGQMRKRLHRLRDQARPAAGIWMPQLVEAVRDGWPDGYTEAGIEATGEFFGPPGT